MTTTTTTSASPEIKKKKIDDCENFSDFIAFLEGRRRIRRRRKLIALGNPHVYTTFKHSANFTPLKNPPERDENPFNPF